MPMMRSPASASATISRYRGSKMWSGRKTFGNRTTFGSGKIGIASGSMLGARSVNGPRLLVHVVHQHILPERVRGREIRLAMADLRDLADEADEIRIARQHE